jgi:multicomponent Na+:H+ antiporter subunit B
MKEGVRLGVFLIAACCVAALLLYGMTGLRPFGFYSGPYGDVLNQVAVSQRHVLNVATAINFDYRGFDTLIEEFIFFTAVAGVALLLREQLGPHGQVADEADMDRELPPESDGIGWMCYGFVPATFLFACYMAVHTALTPGGGFQGGAIAGSGFALAYMGLGYATYRRFAPRRFTESMEAIGGGGYAAIGIATLIVSGIFLKNVLPLGEKGSLTSAGTIPIINLCVFIEIAAGFIVCLEFFFQQTRRQNEEQT